MFMDVDQNAVLNTSVLLVDTRLQVLCCEVATNRSELQVNSHVGWFAGTNYRIAQ